MTSHRLWVGIVFCGLWVGCGATESVRDSEVTDEQPTTTAEVALTRENQEPPKMHEFPEAPEPDKKIYAKSFINKPAPEFIVEEWLTKEPDRKGKMVLIDFWATWCPPCLKSIPELNQIHRKHKDRLVVIGVSDEPADTVRAHENPKIHYAVAIDPEERMAKQLEIEGIPHIIIVDPKGIVRWEGYPFASGQELTEDVVDDLLDTYVP